ncbi:sensor histidine kinase [Aquipuribacter sp. SD81]|uniref:sensor histidine kinase n=1 Tax=Aquipuribacter sp. SD81 TaxID=3127703 RepID=UPI003015CF95
MVDVRRAVRQTPRPAGAAPVGPLDRLLAGGYAVAVLTEALLRPDVEWRVLVTTVALAVAPALLVRRTRPLLAASVGWGATALLSLLQLAAGTGDLGLWSMTAVLLLLFSLVRWGSGRETVLGTAVVAGATALGMYASATGPTEVVGGTVLLLLVAALAVVFRYRAEVWERRRREVRDEERLLLARDLHDTVAHHVSAIAVQAQAGGVIAAQQPARAAAVLAAIEAEASQTLAEMRSMVRVLRDEDVAAYAPGPGVPDLQRLARADGLPAVEVTLDGPFTGLPGPVGATLYRLAQESLTNARRHARDATRVRIDVRRAGGTVRLRVHDDGRGDATRAPAPGYGLRGMAERARLLGGSLHAGPCPEGGWAVEAVLPVDQRP